MARDFPEHVVARGRVIRQDREREAGLRRQHQARHLPVRAAVVLGEPKPVDLADEPGQGHLAPQIIGLDLWLAHLRARGGPFEVEARVAKEVADA